MSTVKQLSAHLRQEIQSGRLGDPMPGVNQLTQQLGVGTRTVIGAINLLEKEGLVASSGSRRRRRIVRETGKIQATKTKLRIQILHYDTDDFLEPFFITLRHQLEQAGHEPAFSNQTLTGLGMNRKRVESMIRGTETDAWIVVSGSKDILKLFSEISTPSYALFGRQTEVKMAGMAILKTPALADAIAHLVSLKHRRIVLMTREERRKPQPGLLERNFLKELEAHGIQTGAYHLPDWENTSEGFHERLSLLFQASPPTAMIFSQPKLFFAAQQFLSQRNISVPRNVSLLVLDEHPSYEWFESGVCHIHSNSEKWIHPVLHWAEKLTEGVSHQRMTVIEASFVHGGTTGPARHA